MWAKQKAKQAKLKEIRKKIKERKVVKKTTKTTEKESIVGHFSDREEATQASKRIKVESNESLRKFKNKHRTSLQTESRRTLTGTSRKNKGTT
jgi:hypothetical protein